MGKSDIGDTEKQSWETLNLFFCENFFGIFT